jgi:hypothetical protein
MELTPQTAHYVTRFYDQFMTEREVRQHVKIGSSLRAKRQKEPKVVSEVLVVGQFSNKPDKATRRELFKQRVLQRWDRAGLPPLTEEELSRVLSNFDSPLGDAVLGEEWWTSATISNGNNVDHSGDGVAKTDKRQLELLERIARNTDPLPELATIIKKQLSQLLADYKAGRFNSREYVRRFRELHGHLKRPI